MNIVVNIHVQLCMYDGFQPVINYYCCYVECSNFGGVRLQQTNVTNFDNGTAAVSGILQFCDYNTWRTVCENNYTDVDYNQFCVSLGYNSELDTHLLYMYIVQFTHVHVHWIYNYMYVWQLSAHDSCHVT